MQSVVRAEHATVGTEQRAEGVGERDDTTTRPQHDESLTRREQPAVPVCDEAQRLRERAQRPEVGAGRDHDLGAAGAQAPDGRGQRPQGVAQALHVHDVVAADHDQDDVGCRAFAERRELGQEGGRVGTDLGDVGDRDGPVGCLDEACHD